MSRARIGGAIIGSMRDSDATTYNAMVVGKRAIGSASTRWVKTETLCGQGNQHGSGRAETMLQGRMEAIEERSWLGILTR